MLKAALVYALAGAGLGVGAIVVLGRVEVTGASMRPTLAPGDRLLLRPPVSVRPGDIVALRDPRSTRMVIKRVVWRSGGRIFVRGDNASASTDSRHYGTVSVRGVRGVAWLRYAPPDRVGRMIP